MKKISLWILGLSLLGFAAMLLTRLPVLGLEKAAFCGYCHVMAEQVQTYQHSPHAREATCGDCHDPHALLPGAIYASYTGSRDVYRVVTNTAPPVIRATPTSKKVVQANCLRCHEDTLRLVGDTHQDGGQFCFDCHRHVVHSK